MLRGSMRAAKPLQSVPRRTMVTETQLRARINTVSNVRKITSTMKMVAAAKLRNAQKMLGISRAFAADVTKVWPDAEVAEDKRYDKEYVVTICSDGGLCGAVNSSIVKMVRRDVGDRVGKNASGELGMTLIGLKSIQALERAFKEKFVTTITECGKLKNLSFRQAALVTQEWMDQEYDRANVYYNVFRSAVSYDTTKTSFFPLKEAIGDGKFLLPYEIEGDQDTLENFYQFRAAVRMFHFISENDTSTLSSRMNAMENSSKNAGEMLDALTLQLNRSRQARITTELIEIISGAAAAEDISG
jgi:F-type H+-transporting ATPase subunit gamma